MMAVKVLLQSSTDTPKVILGEQHCVMSLQWEENMPRSKLFLSTAVSQKISEILSWLIFFLGVLVGDMKFGPASAYLFSVIGKRDQNICLFLLEAIDKHNFIIPFSKGSTEKINILKIPSLWLFFPLCKNIRKLFALNNLPNWRNYI